MAKVFTMTTGELNYDGFGELTFSWLNYVLYCTFVILMPIVFMNLLTSLAISDVTELKKNAKFNLVKLQVKATHAIEECLPERFIKSRNVFIFQRLLSIVRDFLFSKYLHVVWDRREAYLWKSHLKKSSDEAEQMLSQLG